MERIICVIPAKDISKRCENKNHRLFYGTKSITDIACDLSISLGFKTVLISNKCPRFDVRRIEHPIEIDDSLKVWRMGLYAHYVDYEGITILLEPSCPLRTAEGVLRGLERFRELKSDRTLIASNVKAEVKHHSAMIVPSGEFYIAKVSRILAGNVFEPPHNYIMSGPGLINIDTIEEFWRAQSFYTAPRVESCNATSA